MILCFTLCRDPRERQIWLLFVIKRWQGAKNCRLWIHFWIIFEFWRDKGWKEHKRNKLHIKSTSNKMTILWVWSLLALLEVLQWDCQMGTLLWNSLRRTQCYSMKSKDCSLSFHECIYLIFTFQRLPGGCSVCGGLAFFWLCLYIYKY